MGQPGSTGGMQTTLDAVDTARFDAQHAAASSLTSEVQDARLSEAVPGEVDAAVLITPSMKFYVPSNVASSHGASQLWVRCNDFQTLCVQIQHAL